MLYLATIKQRNNGLWKNWKCALICVGMAFATTQYGFDMTAVSNFQTMPGFLMTFRYPNPTVGAIVGTLFAIPFGRYLGRRYGIWTGTVIAFARCAAQIAATTTASLCIGQALMEASNTFYFAFANSYIVECAPPNLRGLCAARSVLTNGVGTLIGALIDERTVFIFFIPESPRWLMLHDRREEAERSLTFLRGKSLALGFLQEEFIKIIRGVEEEKANASASSILDIFRGTNLRRTLLCLAVVASRAASGVWLFLSYGTYFYQQAGVHDVFKMNVYTMVVQLVGIAAGLHCGYKVFGRRTMLLIGTGGAVISMLGPALGATIAPGTPEAAISFLVFTFFYVIVWRGFASSMTWPISAEVVNSRLRVVTLSFASAIDFFFAWLTCFCSPYFINPTALDWGAKYCWIWTASNVLTFAVFWLFLPDMKGRSLEEIDELFEKRVPTRGFPIFECQSSSEAYDIVLHKMEEVRISVRQVDRES
ncbi:general substrate transporter [Jackrogersella minutella]|nr:general substrate transporter [Jackrogersella minutella]